MPGLSLHVLRSAALRPKAGAGRFPIGWGHRPGSADARRIVLRLIRMSPRQLSHAHRLAEVRPAHTLVCKPPRSPQGRRFEFCPAHVRSDAARSSRVDRRDRRPRVPAEACRSARDADERARGPIDGGAAVNCPGQHRRSRTRTRWDIEVHLEGLAAVGEQGHGVHAVETVGVE